jgi:hypothetical protein
MSLIALPASVVRKPSLLQRTEILLLHVVSEDTTNPVSLEMTVSMMAVLVWSQVFCLSAPYLELSAM